VEADWYRSEQKKNFRKDANMLLERTQIITFANQKGGCGKTTGSVNMSAALAREGYSVTLVDADPQCNATDSFGVDKDGLAEQGRYTLADAYLTKKAAREIEYSFPEERFEGRLKLVPGHRGLNTVSHRLDAQLQATISNENYSDLDADDIKNEHRMRLRQSLESLRGHRDLVVIDTPPELGFLMTTALISSDWYVIPVFPSGYDLKGLETLWRTVEKVRTRYNPKLHLLGVLIGNFDTRPKLDNDIQKMLAQKFGKDLFTTLIHRSVKHREASVYGRTIFEHAGDQQAAEQFASLAREILARLERSQKTEEASPAQLLEVNRG
jgi:chromosome partitioning protein